MVKKEQENLISKSQKSLFSENLRILKERSGKTTKEIASDLDITAQTFSNYLRGREPSYCMLIQIAEYFNVSIDFLLGISILAGNKKILLTYGDLINAMIKASKSIQWDFSLEQIESEFILKMADSTLYRLIMEWQSLEKAYCNGILVQGTYIITIDVLKEKYNKIPLFRDDHSNLSYGYILEILLRTKKSNKSNLSISVFLETSVPYCSFRINNNPVFLEMFNHWECLKAALSSNSINDSVYHIAIDGLIQNYKRYSID